MAKSIRSKWKRKCRAIKRERYGKKELDRLKKTLGLDNANSKDVNMTEISEIANVTNSKTLAEQGPSNTMEVDTKKKGYNPKTLRDENGAYPVWLHPRKVMKNKGKKKKGKRAGKGKN